MLVHFRKCSQRHYRVLVERERGPAVHVEPAPGYDDFLPHDLVHFVAEAEWELDDAVFGQLAAGEDPGLFLPVDQQLVDGWVRSRKLRKKRQTEGGRSEAIAAVLDAAWRARTGRAQLPEYWDLLLAGAQVAPEKLAVALDCVDGLARRWHELQVGASLTLEWPRSEGRRPHRQTAKRRSEVNRTVRRARRHRQPT